MNSAIYRITISMIEKLKDFINLNPAYQRDYVADSNLPWQQGLITSIFTGDLVIPNLYARTSSQELARGIYDGLVGFAQLSTLHLQLLTEMIDGQQRFRTIIDFMSDKFKLGTCLVVDYANFVTYDLSNMTWSQIQASYPDIADKFLESELRIVAAYSAQESEVMNMFTKLNDLNSMTDAEKRNALDTAIAAFIRGTSRIGKLGKHHSESPYHWPKGSSNEIKRHILFNRNMETMKSTYFNLSFKRMKQDELLAKIVAISLGNAFTDGVGNPALQKMYVNNVYKTKFPSTKVVKLLDRLYSILEDRRYWKNINLGVTLNLTLIVNYLETSKDIRVKNWNQVMDWFMTTHTKLSEVTPQMLKSGVDETKYHLMTRLNSDGSGLTTRLQYLINELDSCKGIIGVDPKRVITDRELFTLWMSQVNAQGKQICKDCEKPIRFDEAIKGHIVAHSEGGATTIENTKVVCSECNKPRD